MAVPQWHYAVTAWVPFVTGHLSVLGSLWIIWHVLCATTTSSASSSSSSNRSRRRRRGGPSFHNHPQSQPSGRKYRQWLHHKLSHKPHLRMLLAMSLYEVVGSLAQAWTFALSPRGVSGWDGSRGTIATCRMQGFLIQISFGVAVYNAALSLYYYLTICHNLRWETWWRLERIVHGGTAVTVVGLAVAGVAGKLYYPTYAQCFIAPHPLGCETCPTCPPCQGAVTHDNFGWMLFVFGQWLAQLSLVTVIGANALIWKRVRQQSLRMKRYEIQPTATTAAATDAAPTTTTNGTTKQGRFFGWRSRNQPQHQHTVRESMVFEQCFLLTLGFIICYIGPACFTLTLWIANYTAFWQSFVTATLSPLHGFINFCVYSRPIYVQVRQKFGHQLTRRELLQCTFLQCDHMGAAAQRVLAKRQQREALAKDDPNRDDESSPNHIQAKTTAAAAAAAAAETTTTPVATPPNSSRDISSIPTELPNEIPNDEDDDDEEITDCLSLGKTDET